MYLHYMSGNMRKTWGKLTLKFLGSVFVVSAVLKFSTKFLVLLVSENFQTIAKTDQLTCRLKTPKHNLHLKYKNSVPFSFQQDIWFITEVGEFSLLFLQILVMSLLELFRVLPTVLCTTVQAPRTFTLPKYRTHIKTWCTIIPYHLLYHKHKVIIVKRRD